MNRLLQFLLLTLIFTFAAGSVKVFAQTAYYWRNQGADRKWTTKENWVVEDPNNPGQFIPASNPPQGGDVIFDDNSFDIAVNPDMRVIVDMPVDGNDSYCTNFTWAVTQGTPIFEGNGKLTIFGNLKMTANIDNRFTGIWSLERPDPGNLTIDSDAFLNGTLRLSGFRFPASNNNWTLQRNLEVNNIEISSNATLSTNNHQVTVRGNWNTSNGVFNAGTGTVIFNGSASAINTNSPFNNLQVNTGATATLSGAITVNGNLAIAGTLNVGNNNNNIFVGGNWTGNGTFVSRNGTPNTAPSVDGVPAPNSATVVFNGSNPQIITAAATNNEFYNVIINRPTGATGGITFNSDISIGKQDGNTPNGSIQFTRGIVSIPSDAHSLILNTNSRVVDSDRTALNPLLLTGGKPADPETGHPGSYVDGYIVKRHNSVELFTFPLGGGGAYRPAGLNFNNTSTGTFRAKYFRTTPPNHRPNNDPVSISASEYWDIRRTEGNASPRMVLSWQIPITGPAPSPSRPSQQQNYLPCCSIEQARDIVIATKRENQTNWESRGGTNHNITNDKPATYSGFLQTQNAIANERVIWTIGSTVVALPIELLYFRAELKEKAVELSWATAQEVNNDHFSIERSADGQDFSELLRIAGAGNSQTMQQYKATDASPLSGTGYYRLKQTDKDGTFSYSKVAAIQAGKAGNLLQVYQPSAGELQVSYSLSSEDAGVLSVYDSRGIQLWRKSVSSSGAIAQEQVRLGSGRGLYLITLQSSSGTLIKKIVVY
jgi:hypothetical protein